MRENEPYVKRGSTIDTRVGIGVCNSWPTFVMDVECFDNRWHIWLCRLPSSSSSSFFRFEKILDGKRLNAL